MMPMSVMPMMPKAAIGLCAFATLAQVIAFINEPDFVNATMALLLVTVGFQTWVIEHFRGLHAEAVALNADVLDLNAQLLRKLNTEGRAS